MARTIAEAEIATFENTNIVFHFGRKVGIIFSETLCTDWVNLCPVRFHSLFVAL